MRILPVFMMVLLSAVFSPLAFASGKAHHVVLIVWDGMRPDFVNEQNAPTLCGLARDGVWFDNQHPVYPSATEVNGTAIATGAYPAHSGLLANREFRPELDPLKLSHTENLATIRKGDELSRGHYLHMPTVAETLQRKGIKTVVAGAKAVALLHDRADRNSNSSGVTLYAGDTLPAGLRAQLIAAYGEFPGATNTSLTRNDWTTSAVINTLWREGVPEFTLLWMNEPDAAQHQAGPGSTKALAAIKNADDNVARVLRALEAKGVRGDTDVMLVSDHGFSTVEKMVDVVGILQKAGFKAVREYQAKPAKGDVLVIGNGGTVLFYVAKRDRKTIGKLVDFLQRWEDTGVIFTRREMEGTFKLAQAHLDSPDAPDILVSMRWTTQTNAWGTPGLIISDMYDFGPGQGMHVTLSRFDMHNTLVACGPDFRKGAVDRLFTGNVDVAPTILSILGVKPLKTMDGRVLTEAMTVPEAKVQSFEPTHLEVTRKLGPGTWHQYLNFTEVNGVDYLEEGNGYQTPD